MARVLYIDDCHRDRTLASLALRGRGHEFADAADGADGLDQAHSFVPDCIVVNPSVAIVNGDALLHQLRRIAPYAHTVVIGCGLRDRTIESALDNGAHACMSRPYSIDDLVTVVEHAIANEKLGAA